MAQLSTWAVAAWPPPTRDVIFQAIAWILAFMKSKFTTLIHFQPILKTFSLDSDTFSGFLLQASLHPSSSVHQPFEAN